MGTLAIVAPGRLAAIVGLRCANGDGRNEVRAVYGGFGVAMALSTAVALTDPGLRSGIAWTLAAALLGMAGGRLVSLLFERGIGGVMWLILAGELLTGALLVGVAVGAITSLGFLP